MNGTLSAFVASVTLKVEPRVPFECLVESNNENYNLMN